MGRRAMLRAGAGALAGISLGSATWLARRSLGGAMLDDPAHLYADAVESPSYDPSFALWAEPSVGPTGTLDVRARAPFPLDVTVIRAGAEDTRGRPKALLWRSGIPVEPTADPDPDRWTSVVQVPVADWPSGLYLAVATGRGSRRHAPFVVRASERGTTSSQIVVQVPFATYQAYNAWGGASMYRYNSPDGVARTLDLRRPFDVFDGAGFLFYGDWQFARWLARQDRDVSFITSFDLHHDPTVLDGARLFVSVFHDEYWSTPMRHALDQFVASGGNAAFFAANSIYWRVRLDRDTLTCHKAASPADDPHPDITSTWRHALIGRPEYELLGSQYTDYVRYGSGYDWTVSAADHWIYEGTGLVDGDRLAGLVGYEWDHAPDPDLSGLTVLARTPITTDDGQQRRHEATELRHPGGGTVINVGTNYWPRHLLGDRAFAAYPEVQRMTVNVLDHLTRS